MNNEKQMNESVDSVDVKDAFVKMNENLERIKLFTEMALNYIEQYSILRSQKCNVENFDVLQKGFDTLSKADNLTGDLRTTCENLLNELEREEAE